MKKNIYCFLKILGFSKWQSPTTMWKCQCACGKILDIDRRRLHGKRRYISCGCVRNIKSITYFYLYRRRFFDRLTKNGEHWIFSSKSIASHIIVNFFGEYCTVQRVAYLLWNHKKSLDEKLIINNICGIRECVCPSHLRVMSISDSIKLRNFKSKIKGEKCTWKKLKTIANSED